MPPLNTGPVTGGGALTAIGPDGGEKHAHSAGPGPATIGGAAITGALMTGALAIGAGDAGV